MLVNIHHKYEVVVTHEEAKVLVKALNRVQDDTTMTQEERTTARTMGRSLCTYMCHHEQQLL